MNIFMYSDQVIDDNQQIDFRLIEAAKNSVGELGKVKVGYIPSGGDKDRMYYNDRISYYKKYGINDFMFFDLDEEYDESLMSELRTCTIIHLSGGKPVELNLNVRKRQFGHFLNEFIHNGGILVGVSAGAIQMTQSIGLF